MQTKEIYDLIIIGGGPTGMFAAYYAGMRELKTRIIEGLSNLGGQINLMYPEKVIQDIGAIPKIKGFNLVANLHQQMNRFKTDISTNEYVINIIKKEELFVIKTHQHVYYSQSVLLTTGQGIFEPRKLTIDYNEKYEQNNLHYYVDNLDNYQNKKIVILGGGDSAVDWALMLEDKAKEIHLVHRRNRFRAHESSVSQLRNSSITIHTPYVLDHLKGNNDSIHEVVLKERRGNQMTSLKTDYLIVNYGFISKNKQLEKWGVETKRIGANVSQKMETSIPGIFAAGDAADFDGKVKLIASGFGEVPTAINSIIHYLNIY